MELKSRKLSRFDFAMIFLLLEMRMASSVVISSASGFRFM